MISSDLGTLADKFVLVCMANDIEHLRSMESIVRVRLVLVNLNLINDTYMRNQSELRGGCFLRHRYYFEKVRSLLCSGA